MISNEGRRLFVGDVVYVPELRSAGQVLCHYGDKEEFDICLQVGDDSYDVTYGMIEPYERKDQKDRH